MLLNVNAMFCLKFKLQLKFRNNKNYSSITVVAGSIPDGVTGIFHWHNPSGRTMALGLIQSLTEMSTMNISWGVKPAGA